VPRTSSGPTPRTAEPPLEFDTYQFVLLRRPLTAPSIDEDAANALQGQHLGHLAEMRAQGHLVAAGPFVDQPDEAWRGMCLYRVASVDEARRLAELDPSVQAGRLVIDAATWLTPKGAIPFTEPTTPPD
jgi:uncharacterized protein YciI